MTFLTDTGEESEPVDHPPAIERLLSEAVELKQAGHSGPAAVTASAVADAYFGEAIATVLEDRGLGDVAHHLESALRSYALGNSRHVKFYEQMAGDSLRQQPFWRLLVQGRSQRNGWAHGLSDVDPAATDAYIHGVAEMVAHIEAHLESRGMEPPPTEVRLLMSAGGAYTAQLRRRTQEPWDEPPAGFVVCGNRHNPLA